MTEFTAKPPESFFGIMTVFPGTGDPVPLTVPICQATDAVSKDCLSIFSTRETAEEFMAHPWMDLPGIIKELPLKRLVLILDLCVESGWAGHVIVDPFSEQPPPYGPYPAFEIARGLEEELGSK